MSRAPHEDRATKPFVTASVAVTTPHGAGGGAAGATEAHPASKAAAPPPHAWEPALRGGEIVDGRFEVVEPLSRGTGEADLFRCRDLEDGGADIALKLYHHPDSRPKEEVLRKLNRLNHSDIVELRKYGICRGRCYEAMEFCAGGTLLELAPLTEEQLRPYLRQIINGLQFLHAEGVYHRDIKPSNFLFRTAARDDLVVSDFGISSVADTVGGERVTSTPRRFTPDYVPPELLLRQPLTVKSDYYSLGFTLVHLLTGRSLFDGMDADAIPHWHTSRAFELPGGLPQEVMRLIKGLTRFSPEQRWGYKQVQAWLDGTTVLADDGSPDYDDGFDGRGQRYLFLKEGVATPILNPCEMAHRFEDFDVEADLFVKGRIHKWADHFSDKLARRVIEIEEDFTKRRPLGMYKLRYLLDPTQPLEINRSAVRTLPELTEALARPGNAKRAGELLYGQFLECWLDATQADVEPRTKQLVKAAAEIRERVKDRAVGVSALLYTLDPSQPLALGPGVAVRRPSELAAQLAANPAVAAEVTRLLYDGYLVEWLRAAFPALRGDAAAIEQSVREYAKDRELGLWALRWRLDPKTPFPFDGQHAADAPQLARLIDRDARSRQLGIKLLQNGWIRAWLVGTGRLSDLKTFDRNVGDGKWTWPRRCEEILRILDPTLAKPQVRCDPPSVHVGGVPMGSSRTIRLRINNASRGHLNGTVRLTGDGHGITLGEAREIDGSLDTSVTVSAAGMPTGARHSAALIVETNGGKLTVPVSFHVAIPRLAMFVRTMLVATLCGGIAYGFRTLVGHVFPQLVKEQARWVELLDWDRVSGHAGGFPMGVMGVLLILLVGGSLYFAIRMTRLW